MSQTAHVNLVSGFLGTGKTSTILNLLKQRPAGERWAVLVNEFGNRGIDGAIIEAGGGGDIAIREVAGGCLCCAAGTSFRVAITRLLRDHHPDRLLIEPTGLGHASGIIDTLREPELAAHIQLDETLCLVDAREFNPKRLQHSALYASQLQLADVLILNKADLADETQLRAVEDWAARQYPAKHAVLRATHGNIDAALLRGAGSSREFDTQFCRIDDTRQHSLNLRFPPEQVFSRPKLRRLLDELRASDGVLRIKGILRTGKEWTLANVTPDSVELTPISYRRDSRVELIYDECFSLDIKALQTRFNTLMAHPSTPPSAPSTNRGKPLYFLDKSAILGDSQPNNNDPDHD